MSGPSAAAARSSARSSSAASVKPVTNTVNYPANVQACIFWLRNRLDAAAGAIVSPGAGDDDGDDMIGELDAAGERARREPIPSSSCTPPGFCPAVADRADRGLEG